MLRGSGAWICLVGPKTHSADFFSNPKLKADVSTDDWPFFYMPERIYPVSYLVMMCS